ncbi:hypothetical protein, partial [Mycobacterium sp.]|uniref:hypothetical protein n=1 Tax=Mycobacterium sp. TaxID=1785 RepID=UPI003C723607
SRRGIDPPRTTAVATVIGAVGRRLVACGGFAGHAYRKPQQPLRGSTTPTDVLCGVVRAAKIGSEKDIPHLAAAPIDTYVSDQQLPDLV